MIVRIAPLQSKYMNKDIVQQIANFVVHIQQYQKRVLEKIAHLENERVSPLFLINLLVASNK